MTFQIFARSDIKSTGSFINPWIVIRFPSREELDACFASDEYRQIKHEREDNVDARALIVEGAT